MAGTISPLKLTTRIALWGWLGGPPDGQASISLLVPSCKAHWRKDFLADMLRETMAAARRSRYDIVDRLSNTAHASRWWAEKASPTGYQDRL